MPSLFELARLVGGEVRSASGDIEVRGVAPIEHAGPADLSFVANLEFARFAATTKACALIASAPLPGYEGALIVHSNPYWAFAKTAQLFFKDDHGPVGVSPLAFVAPDAVVGERVTVHPFAYVGPGARLGAGCVLYPGVFVGRGASVGEDTVLRANVVLEHGVKVGKRCLVHAGAVLGADGFGFAPGPGSIAKIPQVGGVTVGDDVEIGGNSTVDRGAMSDTRLGNGTKLDSHVHVGHGVVVGEHAMLCGMAAIAGSAKIGDWSIVAGHAGVGNGVSIPAGSTIGAMTGVISSPDEKGVYMGFPAQPQGAWRRQMALQRRLPDLDKKVKELERRLAALEGAGEGG